MFWKIETGQYTRLKWSKTACFVNNTQPGCIVAGEKCKAGGLHKQTERNSTYRQHFIENKRWTASKQYVWYAFTWIIGRFLTPEYKVVIGWNWEMQWDFEDWFRWRRSGVTMEDALTKRPFCRQGSEKLIAGNLEFFFNDSTTQHIRPCITEDIFEIWCPR